MNSLAIAILRDVIIFQYGIKDLEKASTSKFTNLEKG